VSDTVSALSSSASAYYRTIVHLLFLSGIVIFILFLAILAIRVLRRRRALRFYLDSHGGSAMNVATILGHGTGERKMKCPHHASTSSLSSVKATGAGNAGTFLFRLGSLRRSYAQKEHELQQQGFSLIQGPPAYDQVNGTRSVLLVDAEDDKADTVSLTSLPAYSEQKQ